MNLFLSKTSLYTSSGSACGPGADQVLTNLAGNLFAEVALDVKNRDIAERLFTYEIPEHLLPEIFVGSHVLVPFGKQEDVSAFVVSIKDRNEVLASGGPDKEAILEKTRPISEVLDSGLLFARSYIDFLYWIADYYLCSVSEVLAAAIPSVLGLKVKRLVRLLASSDSDDSRKFQPAADDLKLFLHLGSKYKEENCIESLLAAAKDKVLSLDTLFASSQMKRKSFFASFNRLRKAGRIEVFAELEGGKKAKQQTFVCWTGKEPEKKRQQQIIACLRAHDGPILLKQLIEESKCTAETIKRMVALGMLEISYIDEFRNPLSSLRSQKPVQPPSLTPTQKTVLETLSKELLLILLQKDGSADSGQKLQSAVAQPPLQLSDLVSDQVSHQPCLQPHPQLQPWLLHGVTGSGKTEIYMRLIEETLDKGYSALLLVPEISLTPQLARRLQERFGGETAVWHSGLSPGERFDTWKKIQSGELRLILGARSAILLNIPKLGLIILDEEHDGSYKQSSPSPRYSARTLAQKRGQLESCFVLLGSATPDASTFLQAKESGNIVSLPERVHGQELPHSVLVDMRNEFRQDRSIISLKLEEEVRLCLERSEQVILLINRRGYASHVFCRACGHVLRCRHCSVSLVFHSRAGSLAASGEESRLAGGRLSCHHCGFSQGASESCPACQAPFLKQFGLGTQKVEEEIRRLFPDVRVLRLDSDISSRKGAYEEVFGQFSRGEAEILIGTQIVAKGLDIARVTLVGVLAADAAFNLPDFRSLERGFQLLTQVSGRAGRGHAPGKVVLQTYNTELPTLLLAKDQDYASFIEAELLARAEFEYPPFSSIVRVLASGADDLQVQSALERISEEMSNHLEDFEQIRILGPAPCLIERIKGMYRHHLIIKNLMGESGQQAIASFLKARADSPGVRITVDVDPVDLI